MHATTTRALIRSHLQSAPKMPSMPRAALAIVLIAFIGGFVPAARATECVVARLQECTRDLMRYSNEDVAIPATEQEVLDNCE